MTETTTSLPASFLMQRHPEHDAETWERHEALYRGGDFFRKRIARFLPMNPAEPPDIWDQRKKAAAYCSYVGPIVDQFAAQLFAAPITVRACDESGATVEPDDFFASFKEDVDGAGADLVDFVRDGFRDALVKRTSWWLATLPSNGGRPPDSLADWNDRGLGRVTLSRLQPETVLDWECDDRGELLWAVTHEEQRPRQRIGWTRDEVTVTWRVFDRSTCSVYRARYDARDGGLDLSKPATLVASAPHGFPCVPMVRLQMPPGLWLASRLADAQVEHFQLSAGLAWALRRTCYAMPVFKLNGDKGGAPRMGAGYWMAIGQDEDVAWIAPPSQPFEVVAGEIKARKDELYRVAHQMAHGVDNNAAAIGRSGESKQADAAATEVCLKAYGAIVREAIERLYDLVARGRGDSVRFSVEGLDRFNLTEAARAVEVATTAEQLDIPSETFRRELLVHTAEALLPGLEQAKKDTIREEIERGVVERRRRDDEHAQLESAMAAEMASDREAA